MGHTYRGGKSGGELLTLFGGYSHDGVRAAIGVQHTEVAMCVLASGCSSSYRVVPSILLRPQKPESENVET